MRTLVLASLVLSAAFAVDPFVRYIHELQSQSGGFHEVGVESADLKSTANALTLTALYGLKSQVNADDAATFVQNHESTADHGYSAVAGQASDIESTRAALVSYLHLGKSIPNAAEVGDFVRSLFNVNSGLFAGRVGESGDLKSTALAVEALHILGELKKPILQESLKRINDLLSDKVVGTSTFHFSFDDSSATPVTDNYYALLLAKHSGYSFKDTSKWAEWIAALQDVDPNSPTFGGFFSNLKRTAVTPEATAHAALSLHLLGSKIGNEQFLAKYVMNRKSSLADTVNSHLAFAHTGLFKEFFDLRVVYDTNVPSDVDDQIMEGLELVPALVITSFDRKVAHGGFAVAASADGWSSELDYDSNRFGYISGKEFETEGKLGSVTFSFSAKTNVYPIGEITFTKTETKSIGYQLTLVSSAEFAGRAIEAGESVVAGTQFNFGVSLSTSEKANFVSGDFTLDLSVLDASGVVQHKSSVDGSSNDKAIEFSYTLTGEDFPSGAVSFLFEVRNDAGVHTRRSEVYSFDQQMVASHISISGGNKLGSTLKVSMQPGSLKDLHTAVPFNAANAESRKFVLDLVSTHGTALLSVEGKVGASGYTFETAIPASLDFIGSSLVSFRFLTSNGQSVKLQPFDADSKELNEDASSYQLTVNAEIHLSEVEQKPKDGVTDIKFGGSLPFKFQLRDSISQSKVVSGKHSSVSISLVSDTFVSATVASVAGENGIFETTLEVDANAVKGAGEVSISAQGVDNANIPVYRESGKDLASFKVNVGGEIELTSNTYSTSSADSTKTSFVVTFTLSCEGKPLKNAALSAAVTAKNGTGYGPINHYGNPLSSLPVAQDGNARYSLSFALPHNEFSSGEYHIQFRRDVDVTRSGAAASPLLEIPLYHKKVETGGLWLQMELITLVVFVGVYIAVSSHSKLFGRKKDL